jgi:CheY-like chemotaxis protein
MNILIVDDEPEVAEVLATSLNRQGHRTTIVHSGAEALKAVGASAPDAMFLDISMPGMNGLDVLTQLKQSKPSLAVVVITGHATADEIDEVKRLGAVDVIPKPAALTHYHKAIERLGDRKRFQSSEGM